MRRREREKRRGGGDCQQQARGRREETRRSEAREQGRTLEDGGVDVGILRERWNKEAGQSGCKGSERAKGEELGESRLTARRTDEADATVAAATVRRTEASIVGE